MGVRPGWARGGGTPPHLLPLFLQLLLPTLPILPQLALEAVLNRDGGLARGAGALLGLLPRDAHRLGVYLRLEGRILDLGLQRFLVVLLAAKGALAKEGAH